MEKHTPRKISPEAFKGLKEITNEEFGESMSDHEIEEVGIRVLKFFSILSTSQQQSTNIRLTEREQKALDYITSELKADGRPTTRGVAKAVGLKSSRSGARMIKKLLAKRFLERRPDGRLMLK